MKNRILVIGGTGTTGRSVIDLLQKNKADYKALVRDKDKAKALELEGIPTIIGTLGEWPTVESAFNDVDTIYLVTSPVPEMFDLHKGVIDMAVKKGVRKIVCLSAEPASYSEGMPLYEQHAAADKYLQESGLKYVILRPHYFMQNIAFMHSGFIKSNSMVAQYLGDTRIPMIDVRDIAKAAYNALSLDDFDNQVFVLTGPRSINYNDVAEALSNELGRDIQYKSLSYEEQEAGFRSMGLPDWTVDTVMRLFKDWTDRDEHIISEDFETITNSKATDINIFVNEHVQLFK
ncbi:MAG: NmrA family NAD(P)-binding protein [Flavobacteriales bacterium]|nr:NmrA family NAD(P)-binding protein [Flavobacteriales bacterium]